MDRHGHYENLSKYFSAQVRRKNPVYITEFDPFNYLASDVFVMAKIPKDKADIVFCDRRLFPELPGDERVIEYTHTSNISRERIVNLWNNMLENRQDSLVPTNWIFDMGSSSSSLFKNVNNDNEVGLVNINAIKPFITKDTPITYYQYYTNFSNEKCHAMLIAKGDNFLGIVPLIRTGNIVISDQYLPLLLGIRKNLIKSLVDACLDCLLNSKILLEDRAT